MCTVPAMVVDPGVQNSGSIQRDGPKSDGKGKPASAAAILRDEVETWLNEGGGGGEPP